MKSSEVSSYTHWFFLSWKDMHYEKTAQPTQGNPGAFNSCSRLWWELSHRYHWDGLVKSNFLGPTPTDSVVGWAPRNSIFNKHPLWCWCKWCVNQILKNFGFIVSVSRLYEINLWDLQILALVQLQKVWAPPMGRDVSSKPRSLCAKSLAKLFLPVSDSKARLLMSVRRFPITALQSGFKMLLWCLCPCLGNFAIWKIQFA